MPKGDFYRRSVFLSILFILIIPSIVGATQQAEPVKSYREFTWDEQNAIPLIPPEITAVSRSADSATITWQAFNRPEDVAFYKIYRQQPPGGEWALFATTTQTSFTDTDISIGMLYRYRVSAISQFGVESDFDKDRLVIDPLIVGVLVAVAAVVVGLVLYWVLRRKNHFNKQL